MDIREAVEIIGIPDFWMHVETLKDRTASSLAKHLTWKFLRLRLSHVAMDAARPVANHKATIKDLLHRAEQSEMTMIQKEIEGKPDAVEVERGRMADLLKVMQLIFDDTMVRKMEAVTIVTLYLQQLAEDYRTTPT
jgi:hypothetical protein